jgi:MFS family permease
VSAPGDLPAPRLNRLFVIALLLANFGSNVALIAPIQNLLPRMIEQAAGSSGKALGLGIVTGIGALAALVFNPVAGHVSDRWRRTDNRAYTVLIGLVAGTLGHVFLAYQHSVVGIAIWWTICQAAINVAYSPMSAVIVDHVDRKAWGLVWGLVSVAQAVGLIIGLAAVVLVFPSTTAGMLSVAVGYGLFLIPLVVVLRRLPRISSAPTDSASTSRASTGSASTGGGSADAGHARPRRGLISGSLPAFRALVGGRGFQSVMAGRFLIMLAETIALLYLYYYLQDDIRYPNPGHGQLILILIATVATIMATVTVGRVADRSGGYRRYSVLAAVLMAATVLALAGLTEWTLVMVCAFALGAGYGAFMSVSQALSLTVLPDPSTAGRDLGILNIAYTIPQVIGAPIAGVVVANMGGYRGLFIFAALLAAVAAFSFSRVPPDPNASLATGAGLQLAAEQPRAPAPESACSNNLRRAPIASRASRRDRLFGRGAGVAVHARRAPNHRWPTGRSAGRRQRRRHAAHARTRDPGRSVRVPDRPRRWTRGPGRGHRRRPPRPRAVAAPRGSPRSAPRRRSGRALEPGRQKACRRRRGPRAPRSAAPHGPGHAPDAR